MSVIVALDGTEDGQLVCFRDNAAGLRLLQTKRQMLQANSTTENYASSAAADDADNIELDMSVDEVDEEIEPLIDSDDDDDDSDD